MSGQRGKTTMAVAAGAALLVGCFADATPGSSGGSGGFASASGGSGSGGSGSVAQPIIADIDTNGTLITTPGQGIGVYVEYQAGGHWTLSWTCDTIITNVSCTFAVVASVMAPGGIKNPSGMLSSSADSVSQAIPQAIQALTTTTTGTDAVTFDTAPGETLTVSVQLNAPVSFFFVQNNKVNGGYTGALTNPMMFTPTAP